MNKETLMPALANHTVTENTINDKIKRILRIIFQFGFYDKDQLDKTLPENNPDNDKVALQLAENGIVLLKNENNFLPLSEKKIRTLAVIGPDADAFITGGGSSETTPFHYTSILKGLSEVTSGGIKLLYEPGFRAFKNSAKESFFYTASGTAQKGLSATYFDNKELSGPATATRIEPFVDHNWSAEPDVQGMHADNFSIRWTGVIRPVKNDHYRFTVRGDDGFRLWVNEKKIIDDWHDHAAVTADADMILEAGKEYNIRLEYFENAGDASIAFAWYPAALDFSKAVAISKQADAAIVCVGFNNNNEHEGADRSFDLPSFQDSLINAVAAANPNTIVVLNAGGNANMQSWINNVKSVLHAWYAGQEGGTAIAEILFGKINPSGKLPASFEKSWKDNPVFNSYYDDSDKHVVYKEGLFMGYRYWDTSAVKPQYPFGFGLSYTNFSYSNLTIENNGTAGAPSFTVHFNIKNTGNADGAEVSQLYVHQQRCRLRRPVKELKGFSKIYLKKGETKTATIQLGPDAFSWFSGTSFTYDKGMFDIIIGASSADIRLKGSINVP